MQTHMQEGTHILAHKVNVKYQEVSCYDKAVLDSLPVLEVKQLVCPEQFDENLRKSNGVLRTAKGQHNPFAA